MITRNSKGSWGRITWFSHGLIFYLLFQFFNEEANRLLQWREFVFDDLLNLWCINIKVVMGDDVPQKIKIPSFKMRFLKRGFRFWWLRTMSTGVPVSFSRNSFASINRKGFGVSVSTNKSISLPSFCSPLAVEPKSDKEVMPYLSLSMPIYFFSNLIHSSFPIPKILLSLQKYVKKPKVPNFQQKIVET